MGFLDNLGDLARQATGGGTDAQAAYDQIAHTVPQTDLANGLTHAFNSDQTPPFPEMVAGLFNQSTPEQKAGILNKILASLGPGGLSQALGASGGAFAGAGAGASAVLADGTVTAAQAQQITPATVQVLAQNAAKKDPSFIDAAAGFYAQHPTLIKAIGAGALALLMSKISQHRS